MDLSNLMYRRVYTGKPGRPTNSGARDFDHIYEICKRLAADAKLTRAGTIRQVVDTEADYNAVDRITRKLKQSPQILERAKIYRQKAIERFLRSCRGATVEFQFLGHSTREAVASHLFLISLAPPEIWDDPRVVEAIDKVWRSVRPDVGIRAFWDAKKILDRLAPYDAIQRMLDDQYRMERLFSR